jgi:hypothetical protein
VFALVFVSIYWVLFSFLGWWGSTFPGLYILSSLCSTVAVVLGLFPFSGPSGGALGIYFFVHLFSRHSLNVSSFCQTVVVPEWEPVGTAVFCSVSSLLAS